jgi:hypothetical protein
VCGGRGRGGEKKRKKKDKKRNYCLPDIIQTASKLGREINEPKELSVFTIVDNI